MARIAASVSGESGSITTLAFQPGAGVDVRLTDVVGIRIGGDYRRLHSEGAEFRVVTGAVFRVGRN